MTDTSEFDVLRGAHAPLHRLHRHFRLLSLYHLVVLQEILLGELDHLLGIESEALQRPFLLAQSSTLDTIHS